MKGALIVGAVAIGTTNSLFCLLGGLLGLKKNRNRNNVHHHKHDHKHTHTHNYNGGFGGPGFGGFGGFGNPGIIKGHTGGYW